MKPDIFSCRETYASDEHRRVTAVDGGLAICNLMGVLCSGVRIAGWLKPRPTFFACHSSLPRRLVKYELFADMGESEARSVKRTRIVEAFPTVGAKMTSFSTTVTIGSSGLKPSVRTAWSEGANIQDFSKPSERRPSNTRTRTMSDGFLCRVL